MSKNIIFYFTGTGNSLKVAKDVASKLEDCEIVSMPAYKDNNLLGSMDRIGFIFPVYGGLPNFVKKFISEVEFPKDKNIYYFSVVTCGFFKWNSISMINEKLMAKGIILNAGFDIKMVANAIPLYNITKKVESINKKSQMKIDIIAEKIIQRVNKRIPKRNPLMSRQDKFTEGELFPMLDKNYNVSENCNGCGVCSKVCPVKNIEIIESRPVFKHTCEQCMACIHLCPSKAINFENKTQNRRRYINPDVTINEIINGYK
jgi:ferredoxin